MADYNYTGFVNYFGGYSNSALTSTYNFGNGISLNTYASNLFGSAEGAKLPGLTSYSQGKSFDTSGYGGGMAIGSGVVASLYDAVLGPTSGLSLRSGAAGVGQQDSSPTIYDIYGHSTLNLNQADVSKEVAGVLQTLPVTAAGDVSMSFRELGDLLSKSQGKTGLEASAVEGLNASSKTFVERVGGLNDDVIHGVGESLSNRISALVIKNHGDAPLSSEESVALDRYVNGLRSRVEGNLTLVRNVAKSMLTDGANGQEPSLYFSSPRSAGSTISKFFESVGGQGARATEGLNSFTDMGILTWTSASGDNPNGGGAEVTNAAVDTVRRAIIAKAREQGVYSLDEELVANKAAVLTGRLASWATDYRKSLNTLGGTSEGGLVYKDLTTHMGLVDAYDNLPMTIRNGQLVVSSDAIDDLLVGGRAAQAMQISDLTVRSGTVGDVVQDGPRYYEMANKDYPGKFKATADRLTSKWEAAQTAGRQVISIPGLGISMTAEDLRDTIVSGRSVSLPDGTTTKIDYSFLLDKTSDGAIAYNRYLDQLEQFGAAAPGAIEKLAGATKPGYLYDTNVLTGEKFMNGSNWLQLLLAAGGIVTPIVSMIDNHRTTKKNQEYMDRVREEDREFQERLLKMQLASQETQASIAADSKKAVATGSSRTSVTINSPTQSK